MKIKAIVKDWLRSKCGGNNHVALGHLRAYRYPGGGHEYRVEIPVVMAGKRYFLRLDSMELRGHLHKPLPHEIRSGVLWPYLPLRSFGNLFLGDQSPTTIRSELARHYLQLRTWFLALRDRVNRWLDSDLYQSPDNPWDSPWRRLLRGGPFPANAGETKRATCVKLAQPTDTFTRTYRGGGMDPAIPGEDKTVINPVWVAAGPNADIFFLNHEGAFKVLKVGCPPTFDLFHWNEGEAACEAVGPNPDKMTEWAKTVKAEVLKKAREERRNRAADIVLHGLTVDVDDDGAIRAVKKNKRTRRNQNSSRGAKSKPARSQCRD